MFSWLELEQSFRRLRLHLAAYRLEARWSADGESWLLHGPSPSLYREQFEALSVVAGRRFLRVFTPHHAQEKPYFSIFDDQERWYHALRVMSPGFRIQTGNIEAGQGELDHIAEAAADLCLRLHGTHPESYRPPLGERLRENAVKLVVCGILIALVIYVASWI